MAEALTPMMQQYQRMKREIPPDALLLFRLGDFFEMFFEDAQACSRLLNLTLTQRNGVPMCGIPHHSSEGYVIRLVQAGHKVAICDQVEEAGASKGIIRREVTQILSPGTLTGDRFLTAQKNNFIAAIFYQGEIHGFSLLDVSTGEFRLTELPSRADLMAELRRTQPAEVLLPADARELQQELKTAGFRVSTHEPWNFEYETSFLGLRDHFKTQSLDGFGCQQMRLAISAAGGLLNYLQQQLRHALEHVHKIHVYHPGDYMALDAITRRNLELLEPTGGAAHDTSLAASLDSTTTAMGARLLREWISHPLRTAPAIQARHEAVHEFCKQLSLLPTFREQLGQIRDLERIVGRLSTTAGNARDLMGLKSSLEFIPALRQTTARLQSTLAAEQHRKIQEFPDLVALIQKAIADDPPLSLKEGGIIRPGHHPELDELRSAMHSGKEWIAQMQQQEMEKTGIKSLKVRFNSVFGYYIEVTNSNLAQVPPHYIRKQTVTNGERFITPELKEMENKILGAQERSFKLEYEIFQGIRQQVSAECARLQETARALGALDVLSSFAETALRKNYARPEIHEGDAIEILDGRHPVLEEWMTRDPELMGRGGFIPNDLHLNGVENQVIMITGPNMAGKSTFIRQAAILVLMAHAGSFVPARSARIGLVDRIFTRVGASDDLSRGQSTFMVEMNETASILNNATDRSLVILDEIGRGTSTYDGISIAWGVAEYIHEKIKCRTLFATHYHELTAMAQKFTRIKNFNVQVREWNDQVIFLRKIQPGAADRSYGIQVARLAGLPAEVIDRARQILGQLESSHQLSPATNPSPDTQARPSSRENRKKSNQPHPVRPTAQMLLFAAGTPPPETP